MHEKEIEIAKKATRKILRKYKNKIKAIILHGSVLNEDFDRLSDIDLIVVTKGKIKRSDMKFKYERGIEYPFFQERIFEKMLEERWPIALSSLRGYSLYGKEYTEMLKEKNFNPDERTKKRCLLNAYCVLGKAMSEIDLSYSGGVVEYSHHAARHALWALVMDKKFMPQNSELLAISQKKHAMLYSQILKSRKNFEKLEEIPFDEMKKIYKRGFGENKTVKNVKYAEEIIRDAWKKTEKKKPKNLEKLIFQAKKEFSDAELNKMGLLVDWKKEMPYISFSFLNKNNEDIFREYNIYGNRMR